MKPPPSKLYEILKNNLYIDLFCTHTKPRQGTMTLSCTLTLERIAGLADQRAKKHQTKMPPDNETEPQKNDVMVFPLKFFTIARLKCYSHKHSERTFIGTTPFHPVTATNT